MATYTHAHVGRCMASSPDRDSQEQRKKAEADDEENEEGW